MSKDTPPPTWIATLVVFFSTGVVMAAEVDTAPQAVDWPRFMRQHDMTFDKLPTGWKDSPYFGNAMVGSMFYQQDNAIKLQVFRGDVQDHRTNKYGWTAYSRPRLMIGYFLLQPVGKLTGCNLQMDIWNAEMTGTITTDKGEIRIHHFVHAHDMAIVTELTPSAGEQGCSWTWHPAPAQTTRPGRVSDPNPKGRREDKGDVAEWVQDLRFGGQYATAWSEQTQGDTRTLLVSIANSYPKSTAAATALASVERFRKLDKAKWIEAHRKWWHDYYPRSFVSIPDKGIESLYWQTMYRYGCTSRTGRCFVDTSGMWFQGHQWPYITTDWNIQSAHWAVYTANRLEQGQELVNKLYEGREALVKAVLPEEWQKDSAYMALAVAPDMIGMRNGDMRYFHLVGDLPWVMNNAWSQYRYSMDDEMLRVKIYPLLRRSINFYLHMVEKGDDGKYHLPPTYSPESGIHEDCNFDLALLKWGCYTLIKASKRLGIDDPLIGRWKEMVENLPDFPADEFGFRYGSDHTSPPSHRHLSHLLMIYPLYVVNIEQEGSQKVLDASFDRVFANQRGGLAAMVQTHLGPIAAALGKGDMALDSLKRLQADLQPNGLWGCGDNPCIESTLGLAIIVQDMLLQSWTDPAKDEPGPIRVFPAVPSAWKDIEFHDLRAEGAFLVSAKRAGGKTQWVRIKSLAGEPCRVRPGLNHPVAVKNGRPMKLQPVSQGVFEVDISKGEEVVLHAAKPKPNIVFIFSDDLSYRDLSYYGQKHFSTPNLDRLAAAGIRFNVTYAGAPECAPSRASLMTGMHMGHCRIRCNRSARGGQDHLLDEDVTIAEVLRQAGYATGFIGKWGIGLPGTEGTPDKQGFNDCYGYYDQLRAHTFFPHYLMRNGRPEPLPGNYGFNMPRVYRHSGDKTGKHDNTYDTSGKLLPDGVKDPAKAQHSEDLFQKEALKYIRKNKDRPFFLYYATQLPHGPCITPDLGAYKDKPWDQKHKEWACMVEHMDRGVGKMVGLLEELGILENTVIFFAGDNGYSQWGYFGRPAHEDDPLFKNKGPWPKGKFTCTHEGGMRVPFFVYWKGTIRPQESDHVCALYDILATMADLTDADSPKTDGISLAPTLLGKPGEQRKHPYLYWENGGRSPHAQSVRMDQWWACRNHPSEPIELYDIRQDIDCEKHLAKDQPAIVAKIEGIMKEAHTDSRWYRNPGESKQQFAAKRQKAAAAGQLQNAVGPNTVYMGKKDKQALNGAQ